MQFFRLVHLKSRHHQRKEQQQQQQIFIPSEQQTFIPSEQYSEHQQTTTIPGTTSHQSTTTKLVYPSQSNMRTVGYIESTIPPHMMFNSQQPLQLSPQQIANHQMAQPTPHTYLPQQTAGHQMVQPTPHTYLPQQTVHQQMVHPTPYNYPPQQAIPNSPYGYTQY